MHARHDDVECHQHIRGLIECSILVDVDLDAAENTKRRRPGRCFSGKLIVDALDLFELSHEALSRESVRNGEVGRVIGHDDVLVTQRTRSVRHLNDGTAAVGPERVRVTVTSQRSPKRIARNSKRLRLRLQLRKVFGDFARQRFHDHGLCCLTDSLQGAKPVVGDHSVQFAGFERGDCLGGATECSDAIRRRLRSLQQQRDPPQRHHRVHEV